MDSINNSFSQIAHVYDRFNNNDVYQNWLGFTLRQLEEFPHKALDVACGTGILTETIAPFVEEMYAIDYDEAMINQAKQLNSGSDTKYLTMNMLDMSSLPKDFNLITCYLDSLCFLNTQEELEIAFKQIYEHLSNQGVFIFDVWTKQSMVEMDGYYYFDEDDQAALLWESELLVDNEPFQVQHKLTVFERVEQDNLYQRIDVDLIEQTFTLTSYIEFLVKAGFERRKIEVYGDFGYDQIISEEETSFERWFIKVTK